MRQALLLLSLLFPLDARAGALWGPEFTFTNKSMLGDVGYGPVFEAQHRMGDALKALCAQRTGPEACVVKELLSGQGMKYKIEYTNLTAGEPPKKVWFQVGFDPNVVEVQGAPMALADWEKHAGQLQKDVFEVARGAGLAPDARNGMGHLNMGLESQFGEDLDSFVDFMVDTANHPELGMGAFGFEDAGNAPVLSRLSEEQRRAFARLVAEARAGKIKTIEDFVRKLRKDVYYKTKYFSSMHEKYQAVNVESIEDVDLPIAEKRVELRFVQAQKDVKEFIRQGKLFDKRVEYLKKLRGQGKPVEFMDAPLPKSSAEGVSRYRAYVEETGLKWEGAEGYRQGVSDYWKPGAKFVKPVANTAVGAAARAGCLRAKLETILNHP